jgi:thiol:disulfide interchange protein DsbD
MAFSKLSLLLIFSLVCKITIAQDSLQVQWETLVKEAGLNGYEITFTGTIPVGWHLYSEKNAEEGLNGLVITFNDSSLKPTSYSIQGNSKRHNDPIFQKLLNVLSGQIEVKQQINFTGEVPSRLGIQLNYDVADNENFYPEEQNFIVQLDSSATSVDQKTRLLIPTINLAKPLKDCGASTAVSRPEESNSLFNLFFLGFVGGLIALLTPCVFPMIPLTVSFFTKKSGTKKSGIKNAFIYGFFIFLIYILLSVPFHFLDKLNPDILNNISTNVILNVIFFAVFVFFAFSFFGFYEISLPSSFSSKADSKAGGGNIAGIFFMALTLAIVSFSCTGPILGSLLAGSLSRDGGAIQLTSGMAGFGLALALPFALFALFPNWLNSLPKSGGWLNTVKVVLGFIELALAFKFLSNADLVQHWGVLKREIFIAIWIIMPLTITLYRIGSWF